jgi:hypothetical protein
VDTPIEHNPGMHNKFPVPQLAHAGKDRHHTVNVGVQSAHPSLQVWSGRWTPPDTSVLGVRQSVRLNSSPPQLV